MIRRGLLLLVALCSLLAQNLAVAAEQPEPARAAATSKSPSAPSAKAAETSKRGAADDDELAERFEEAREHLQKGRLDEAEEVYDALVEDRGDPAQIARGRADCQVERGDLKQAAAIIAVAVKAAPKDAVLWARLAELQFAQGQFAETAKSLQSALALEPDLPLARLVQADLWTATGKLKEADEAYRWFVRLYNQSQPDDAETLLLIARGASQYARWHGVPQIFDFVINTLCPDALAKDKLSWQTYYVSGALLLEKYNRAQALPEFSEALTINPRAADVHAALGMAALQEHDLAEADKLADRALEINPQHLVALHIKADLKLEDMEIAAARKFLDRALQVNPHDERTLARVATCHVLEDGLPPAKELDELLSNLDSIADADLPKPARFTRLTMELAARNPHPGVFLTLVAQAVEARRKFDLAERLYRQAMQSMPQLSEPKTSLGMLCMRVGKNDEARKILDQAFEADPYHVRVSNMRKVLKLLDGYETLTSEHFVIRVDSQHDKLLGQYMLEFLEEEYPALVEQFGFEPETRTQFEIYNKAKGLSGHQWFSARMVGLPWIQTIGASTGMIVALASPTATDKPFNWARVLKHEFVHILTLQKTRFNIPHWYTEALAVMSEGYPRPATWDDLLLERVPKGDLMNLDTVNLGFIRPKTPLDWQMAYCQSQLYAQYMLETYGPDSTARFLDAYRDNLTTAEALKKVFNVEQAAFEAGYVAYLKRIVQEIRGGASTDEVLSLAEIEKRHLADPDNTAAAARFAHELMKSGKRREARRLAEKALEKNKAEPLAAVVMAQLELRAEDVEAAVAHLEPALDRKQPHPEVLALLAQLRVKQDQNDEAVKLYQLGIEHFPRQPQWLKGLAAAYLERGDTAKLKGILQKLADIDADDGVVRKKLARIALDEKSYGEAVKYGKRALHVDVLDLETHRILAEAYTGLQQPEQALREWQVAAELKPDDSEIELALARAESNAGQKDAALKRLKKLLRRDADNKAAKTLLDELE